MTLKRIQIAINEVRKSLQDPDKKVSNMERKFSKQMDIMKTEMLEMKTSINQIITTVTVLLIDKIKEKKEYQRQRARLRRYCMHNHKDTHIHTYICHIYMCI
jgi:hypothetical protein